jgi:hypothetical protein
MYFQFEYGRSFYFPFYCKSSVLILSCYGYGLFDKMVSSPVDMKYSQQYAPDEAILFLLPTGNAPSRLLAKTRHAHNRGSQNRAG